MSFKRCKVVMLSTNQKANELCIRKYTDDKLYFLHGGGISQNLYFLSDDEIKEGDWMICDFIHNPDDSPYYQLHNDFGMAGKCCKKIIATTDNILAMLIPDPIIRTAPTYFPIPSQSFIEKYIKEYNNGTPITEVLVEYEDCGTEDKQSLGELPHQDSTYGTFYMGHKLKINLKDNTITIKKVKDSWTREEVIKFLHNIAQDAISEPEIFVTGICFDKDKFNNWIESNL